MKKFFLIPVLFLFSFLFTGCNSICDRADDHVRNECNATPTGQWPMICIENSEVGCMAQCDSDAPCALFDGSVERLSEEHEALLADYMSCLADCSQQYE